MNKQAIVYRVQICEWLNGGSVVTNCDSKNVIDYTAEDAILQVKKGLKKNEFVGQVEIMTLLD